MINYLSRANKKDLAGTALLRLDFNTEDDWRMQAVLPTIKLLLKTSSKIIIISHRGRPTPLSAAILDQKKLDIKDSRNKDLTLRKDAGHLSRLLGKKVSFIENFHFEDIKVSTDKAPKGSVFLLENLRFMKGEEENERKFAESLASLADFYVNDAFAVSHRANASVAAITQFLPSYAGLELESEIKSLSQAMQKPKRPLVLVLGGAKAADKLGVIAYFKNKADWFVLGGGPANTILSIQGMDVKKSLKDNDPKSLLAMRQVADYKNLVLPIDFKWHDDAILDFGPKTIALFSKKIQAAKTILWSGPISMVEKKADAAGSLAIAKAIVKNKNAFSIAGGGETVMFLKKMKLDKKFSFISTGGGAMLDFLAGEKLPGIEALRVAPLKSGVHASKK